MTNANAKQIRGGSRLFSSAEHPLSKGIPPEWASSWGEDEYGPWVEISYPENSGQSVNQRLRWVGPGSFLMGSPETEEGRFGEGSLRNEGPQHRVTLSKGYWLFDTPVTQGLWQAVMENNPSGFKSEGRPVERVSWDDAQTFLERINNSVPDLDLTLPTEAQWEYACRAGTDMATYAGTMKIAGERNASVLDTIAWYGGNSGVEFDLEGGYDSSDWKEKQYQHSTAGTRIVGLKEPNGWGLYDMLGNVWEWCDDGMRDYGSSPEFDPTGPLDNSLRALRGGSWLSDARLVRAATRIQYVRDFRDDGIGFRCARVQE